MSIIFAIEIWRLRTLLLRAPQIVSFQINIYDGQKERTIIFSHLSMLQVCFGHSDGDLVNSALLI